VSSLPVTDKKGARAGGAVSPMLDREVARDVLGRLRAAAAA
jgi:hypothetical protein